MLLTNQTFKNHIAHIEQRYKAKRHLIDSYWLLLNKLFCEEEIVWLVQIEDAQGNRIICKHLVSLEHN